ncbi:MAG: bifunctional diaminohydroxyphosphoribosylaminopyrimidine deaminase/5-amino-6-(5-phosphoribosylamino)uracil reductase RibD [Thermaerobacter sp.]|nr:bifunctional diaminohydroxyphosphoribosylaminopyrimidine deaminase/5-amino-6-(5-phosphoribosylamino)uracil reductase RibD [Thermaerobacter sp.]
MISAAMRRALTLARRGASSASPNPMVGAVVVDASGRVVGEGYHVRAGSPHAEVIALTRAGERAQNGRLFVTLEPCNHHGRTPPCTEAILRAGIKEVVVASRDPNPHVAGKGIERLREAGVTVVLGDGSSEAERLNRPFFTWTRRQRPFILLKSAMTLDGKVATRTGESRYLTGSSALSAVHEIRRTYDAIMVGVGTVLADDPALTYRGPRKGRDPVRVVLDSRGRTPASARLFHSGSAAPTLVFATERASLAWEREIFSAGGEVITVGLGGDGRVALDQVMTHLADRQILSVLAEGGPTVHASLIRDGLADSWLGFVAPLIVGGPAPTPVAGDGVAHLADASRWVIQRVQPIGPDALIEADFAENPAP